MQAPLPREDADSFSWIAPFSDELLRIGIVDAVDGQNFLDLVLNSIVCPKSPVEHFGWMPSVYLSTSFCASVGEALIFSL